jgi:hypothetical protein
MQTLSYGYLKPETPDKGSTFFPALEFNIERTNDHDHEGVNSKKISAIATTAIEQSIVSASFAVQPNGDYRVTVTMPSLNFDEKVKEFQITSGAHANCLFYPTVERINATQFYVFASEPLDFKIRYI